MSSCPTPLLSLPAALNIIRQTVQPLTEPLRLPLSAALNHILAEPVLAPSDFPPFANSAMDGYALRSVDTAPGARLKVIGTVYAGAPFTGTLEPGSCVRIFTGAPVPAEADAVVIQENVTREGDDILLGESVKSGDHIRPRGDEARTGDLMLAAGQTLTPEHIGLLASLGLGEVSVIRKPKVAILKTGNELRRVGTVLEPGQIYDSNGPLLTALLGELGMTPIDYGIVPDDPATLRQALIEAATDADVILTTGGASVGDADWVVNIVRELGQIGFWQVAIKPGKPFLFGQIGTCYLFGLPGNPVAVAVTFRQLVYPALMALMGGQAPSPLRLKARSMGPLRKQPGRLEFKRGTLWRDEQGDLCVSAFKKQGSHQLSGFSAANCFILLDAECASVEDGAYVTVELIQPV